MINIISVLDLSRLVACQKCAQYSRKIFFFHDFYHREKQTIKIPILYFDILLQSDYSRTKKRVNRIYLSAKTMNPFLFILYFLLSLKVIELYFYKIS